MRIQIRIGNFDQTYVPLLTDAPPSYDGFGTFTVHDYGHPLDTKGPARVVMVGEEHLQWQTSRYQSGLHAARGDHYGPEDTQAFQETLYARLIGKAA